MKHLYRRNFLPTVIINLILWIISGLIIFFLDPERIVNFKLYIVHFYFRPNIILFFITLTLSLTLTFALLLGNTRRGLLTSLFIVLTLFFGLLKIAYWWTILPLGTVLLMIEVLLTQRNKKTRFRRV